MPHRAMLGLHDRYDSHSRGGGNLFAETPEKTSALFAPLFFKLKNFAKIIAN
jgi:hypothetical protein